MAYNSAGVLHVSDDSNRVFQVAADGTVTVLLDQASGLDNPNALAFDADDNLYVLSSGGFLTRFDASTLTPTVITGGYNNSQGIVISESENRIYVSEESGKVFYITLSGAAASSSPGTLYADTSERTEGGLIRDSSGNIYLSAYDAGKVMKIDSTGAVSDHVTGISQARGLAFDSTGVLYVTSYDMHKVYRIDPSTGSPVLYAPSSATPGTGLPGWKIYLDLNANGTLDAGEPSQITDLSGRYEFTGLAAGNYIVREVMQSGWTQVFPGAPSFQHDITLAPNEIAEGINFQNVPEHTDPTGDVIVKHPSDKKIELGSPVVFSIGLDQKTHQAAIQWYHNEQPIPGATGPELRIESVTASDKGSYKASVSVGQAIEFSRVAMLDVLANDNRSGTFTFGSAEHEVNENGHGIMGLIIERKNGNSGDVEIVLNVIDGSATVMSGDLKKPNVKVSFKDGEISKKIDFTSIIADDSTEEANENFSLELSLPEGAPEGLTIGDVKTTVVTIVDNDEPNVVIGEKAELGITSDEITIKGTVSATYKIQTSQDLKNWNDWISVTIDDLSGESSLKIDPDANPIMFYRVIPTN